ncbi:MAG: F0F1 ATP synthase subunit delta [Candidatus Blackburnbacteria bacterium]|nr:F0F1 ATP synthase subunit delta [Candidatus Blackburnbacteria bacterium]
MKETKRPPVLTLFLPFEASRDFLKEIRENLQKKIPGVILHIKIDPTLLGGATIVYKDQLRDYSLKNAIEQNKAKIAQKYKNA